MGQPQTHSLLIQKTRMAEKENASIVFISSIFRDLVAVSDKFPRPGETIFGSEFRMGFGGKGANQCVMAARLGAATTIVAKVGGDEHGEAYKANLVQQKVNIKHLGVEKDVSTGIATILVEASTGENMIVIVPGANARLSEKDANAAVDDITRAGVVVGVLEVGIGATLQAFTTARIAGVTTVLNAAPARSDVPEALLAATDILCVNQTEAEVMSGKHEVEAAALALSSKGCRCVIVTLGAEGALVLGKEGGSVRVTGAPVEKEVVDTTGAGDAFVGGLAFFLACRPNMPLEEAVRRSCSLASITVQRPGTQASYPDRKEVLKWL